MIFVLNLAVKLLMSLRALIVTEKPVSHSEQVPATVSSHETLEFFEHILNEGLILRVRVTGRSMIPFLRGEEILTIRKVPYSSLRNGDIIFFKNRAGYPFVHRIVRKSRNGDAAFTFQTKGDAMTLPDEPVPGEEILGKVCKVENESGDINLEAGIWRMVNYLAAAVDFFEAQLRIKLGMILRSARGAHQQ